MSLLANCNYCHKPTTRHIWEHPECHDAALRSSESDGRASAEPRPDSGIDDLKAFAGLLEAEWRNGNLDERTYKRLNADLTGILARTETSE